MTKFILDSGNIEEYKEISQLMISKDQVLWGSTTNPSLIAKALNGKKATAQEAFSVLQKQIVMDILQIVPGAVSAEVYSTATTAADEMISQGKEIANWDSRVVVKLPTTIEGFKARTELRKLGICINNTLVFSQEQCFAITLHEKIMRENFGPAKSDYPPFISPFVGRLDDIGLDGLSMVEHSVNTIRKVFEPNLVWMLEASVRNLQHVKKGLDLQVELITAPAKVYTEWLSMTLEQQQTINTQNAALQQIPLWEPTPDLISINTIDSFMDAIVNKKLDIHHDLTDKGIEKFVSDWSAIIV